MTHKSNMNPTQINVLRLKSLIYLIKLAKLNLTYIILYLWFDITFILIHKHQLLWGSTYLSFLDEYFFSYYKK